MTAVQPSDVSGRPLNITVNGLIRACPAGTTVAALVAGVSRSRAGIAVAVGDTVVPRAQWNTWTVREGDEIEILTAVQGG